MTDFRIWPVSHGQSWQDDHFDALLKFADWAYLNLVLAAIKRPLNVDELAILERAALVVGQLHPRAGVAFPEPESQRGAG